MSFVAVAVAGVGVAGSIYASNRSSSATREASEVASESNDAAIAEQQRQFNELQTLFAPFVEGGTSAFGDQLNLIGVNGDEAQAAAIANIENGPEYQTLVDQGEEAILQNASATGGLRGGDVQRSLAEFRPQVLSSLINNQFSRLGSLSSMGQASAGGQAVASGNSSANISNLIQSNGTTQAQLAIANGQNQAQLAGDVAGAVGHVIGKKF
jgi:hypothetical protein